jgi:hypothetical protein
MFVTRSARVAQGVFVCACVCGVCVCVCHAGALLTALNWAGLARNTSLESLDLGYNPIGNDGAAALAAALHPDRCAVTTLNLANCAISEEGIARLASALEVVLSSLFMTFFCLFFHLLESVWTFYPI